MGERKVWTEQIRVKGDALVGKAKDLVREGNVRRIIIKNDEGESVVEIPVTFGVIGVLAAPAVSAIGAVAALAARWTIEVVREEPGSGAPEPPASPSE